ncbi:MAG: glycosyltransferase [Candidatus Auribacterota bacterium]
MLSICMIVKNEERCIAGSLSSIRDIADEIIVVDTGSTDLTADIAREYGADVYHFMWNNDFSAARNYSIEMAKGDWILFIDADECISEGDCFKIKSLLKNTQLAGYMLIQRNYTDNERLLNYKPCTGTYGDCERARGFVPVERIGLFRNLPSIRFSGVIHETVGPAIEKLGGVVGMTDIAVHHYGHLDTAEKERKTAHYLALGLRQIQLTPEDPKPYNDIGIIYLSQGDFISAEKFFLNAYDRNPDYHDLRFHLATLYFRWLKYDESIRYLNEVLAANPHHQQALLTRGIIADTQGDYQSAEHFFSTGLNIYPDSIAFLESLAFVQVRGGNISGANNSFSILCEKYPENEQYALEYVKTLYFAGDFQRALDIARNRITQGKGTDIFALWILQIYDSMGEHDHFDYYINLLKQAGCASPELKYFEARAAEINGDIVSAVKNYKRALQQCPELAVKINARVQNILAQINCPA